MLALAVIINISSNSVSRRSGGSDTSMTIIMGKTTTTVLMMSKISERMPWAV